MFIEELRYKVRDITRGFVDDDEYGVRAFSGGLDVRPPFHRGFVWSVDKQQSLIQAIISEAPIGAIYWGKTEIPAQYELIDGQQRIMSICRFVKNLASVSIDGKECLFSQLPKDMQDRILNYELQVFVIDAPDSEKLNLFMSLNIPSEALTAQEVRNAVYAGLWLADAKRYFVGNNCEAAKLGRGFVPVETERGELLERVLKWIADLYHCSIDEYMSRCRHDKNADELWSYYQTVIKWAKSLFGVFHESKVQWGRLFNKYHDSHYVNEFGKVLCTVGGVQSLYTVEELAHEVEKLQADSEVTSKTSVFEYVLCGNERKLSLRKFSDKVKMSVYRKQSGKCAICDRQFYEHDMVADRILPWSKGGQTVEANCQLICVPCSLKKRAYVEQEYKGLTVSCKKCGKQAVPGMYCQHCGTKN